MLPLRRFSKARTVEWRFKWQCVNKYKLIQTKNSVAVQLLLRILPNIQYLGRQVLPLRGDWHDQENSKLNQF